MRTKDLFTSPINIILLSIVAITAFYFSMNSPWTGDDMMYGYKITEEYVTNYRNTLSPDFVPERIESFGDLIESQNNHFFLVNGRYVAHILVQIFCSWLGPVAFSICNVAVWLALIYLLIRMSGGIISDCRRLMLTIILVVLTYLFKMVPSTEIGYVWMSLANLTFLNILFGQQRSIRWTVPLLLFSIFSGNGNETFSSGISVALIFYMFRNAKNLSLQKWLMIVGYGIGSLVLVVSPGSWHRIGNVESQGGFGAVIALTVGMATTLILVGMVIYLVLVKRINLRQLIKESQFYWIAFAVCLMFCMATGAVSIRSLCGTNLMAIILVLRLIKGRHIHAWLLLTGVFAVITVWSVGYYNQRGQKATLEVIERKFATSTTGDVYVNIWPTTPLMSNIELGLHLEYPDMKSYWYRVLMLHMREKYGLDKELRIYPTFLEGKDSVELENQTIKIHSGVFLVIVKDGTKPTVNITRGLDFGLFSIPYDTYTPTLTTPIKEGKNWKAYMVYDDMYLISNLNADIDGKPAHK